METKATNSNLIAKCYADNSARVQAYIAARINSYADAENLAQDVWLRLLEYDKPLTAETMVPLIYTIASNLIIDYLRRYYRSRKADDELRRGADETDHSVESRLLARDMAQAEQRRVECLPRQRRIIYVMSRYEEKSVEDIASELSLSFRTVENHLRIGRRDVRQYMSAAIS